MKQFITYSVFAWLCIGTACNSSSEKKENSGASDSKENISLTSGETPSGKYQIKSGRYKTKSQNTVMTAGIDSYTLVSFDDYGKKELTETVTKVEMTGIKQETHNYSLMLADMIYNWDAGSKTGTKYSISGMLDKNVDYEKLSDELKKQYKYQELGTETILGKECKKISVEVSPGAAAIVHTYKGIPMRSEANVGGMKMITEVTELDENAGIAASTYEVPADITFTEMKMPGR
jgi:hypothetical protein